MISARNKQVLMNVLGAFFSRGLSMLLALITMPLYMFFFSDKKVLGLWFTILSMLNWLLVFDIGIGNGLRNHLTIALAKKNSYATKALISTSYILLGVVTCLLFILSLCIVFLVDWNDFFNISESIISNKELLVGVLISVLGVILSFYLRLINSIYNALQLSVVPNFLALLSSFLITIFLFVVYFFRIERIGFVGLSLVYAISINVPLLLATGVLFYTRLKKFIPKFSYFDYSYIKKISSLGISFFTLQVLYMLLSTTNEFFISKFFDPSNVVEYQIYFKYFSLFASLFTLALAPLWSAITKAFAENDYKWILKTYRNLTFLAIIAIVIQVLMIFVSQPIIDFWLKSNSIIIYSRIALSFALYSVVMIWVAIQSTIVAGVGVLKIQLYCYLFAVFFKFGVIVLFHQFFSHWVFVVDVSIIALLPYCIIQPLKVSKLLESLYIQK